MTADNCLMFYGHDNPVLEPLCQLKLGTWFFRFEIKSEMIEYYTQDRAH